MNRPCTLECHPIYYAPRVAQRFGASIAIAYVMTALRQSRLIRDWQMFVTTQLPPARQEGFMVRILRPYMRRHFTPLERSALLREHYAVMTQHFTMGEHWRAEPGMALVTLTGKNEAAYQVYLGGNTSKEGELSLGLYDGEQRYLAKMAVTIGRDEAGQPVLWIGGLQGAKPPMGRDAVVKATRDLFGLRPKGAVILAAQCLAQQLGLTALRAPGSEGHISQRGIRWLRAKRKIYADYGQFWEEIGGTRISDEEYRLPVTPQVRDVSEVKPHKRSEWKKRQALSEQLMTQMRAALMGLQA